MEAREFHETLNKSYLLWLCCYISVGFELAYGPIISIFTSSCGFDTETSKFSSVVHKVLLPLRYHALELAK